MTCELNSHVWYVGSREEGSLWQRLKTIVKSEFHIQEIGTDDICGNMVDGVVCKEKYLGSNLDRNVMWTKGSWVMEDRCAGKSYINRS